MLIYSRGGIYGCSVIRTRCWHTLSFRISRIFFSRQHTTRRSPDSAMPRCSFSPSLPALLIFLFFVCVSDKRVGLQQPNHHHNDKQTDASAVTIPYLVYSQGRRPRLLFLSCPHSPYITFLSVFLIFPSFFLFSLYIILDHSFFFPFFFSLLFFSFCGCV